MPKQPSTVAPKVSTEELILEAAQQVFLEKGMSGARMQEIADRAGINKALLHYYFRSKEQLFKLIVGRAVGTLLPRMLALLESDLELFEKIRRVVREYITFVSANSFLPLFVVNEINRNPEFFFKSITRKEKPRLDAFHRQVAEAVAEGRIRPMASTELLMNMMSMAVFPFMGKPIFQAVLALSEADFQVEMERRRTEVAEFVIRAIQA
ncbi:TetR/AcrR family transcriptional regulator [Hymenobacter rubripertinctus]|uniref:TetR/AcrR family transcriptional regulator n=1 Tax=Hymenobacter rubripertinctus TaxID=2029981 RepID=A0A418QQN6_9BACT|nr:TetR/AcrR family transcriptional regulator [Hymenobacter rubripertinctus]RIY07559.1 TetR/AcrR family transcriptional regulator [Hymenobacter rubripertinctus]